MKLKESLERDMLHALGVSHINNNKIIKGEKYYPKPISTRNYYQIGVNEEWEELLKLGYVKRWSCMNLNYYSITDLGVKYLLESGYDFEMSE